MTLLDLAQLWMFTRFLRGDRSFEVVVWARGDDDSMPNLATATSPGHE